MTRRNGKANRKPVSRGRATRRHARRQYALYRFTGNKVALVVLGLFLVSVVGFVGLQIYQSNNANALRDNSRNTSISKALRTITVKKARGIVNKDKNDAKKAGEEKNAAQEAEARARAEFEKLKQQLTKAVSDSQITNIRRQMSDAQRRIDAAKAAGERASKAEAAAKKKVADREKWEKEYMADLAKERAEAAAKAEESARARHEAAKKALEAKLRDSKLSQAEIAQTVLRLATGDTTLLFSGSDLSKKIKDLSDVQAKAKKVQEASSALDKARSTAKAALNTAVITENLARGLTTSGRVAALTESGCENYGRVWANGKCQDKCRDGNKTISSYNNYCGNAVTPTISKSQCENELGRKWIANTGCARVQYDKNGSVIGNPCSNSSDKPTGGDATPYDYCGDRGANVANIRPVTPQNILKPIAADAQTILSNGVDLSKIRNSSATDCVRYVGQILLQTGINYGADGNRLANGRDYVNALKANGWRQVPNPSPGAVASYTAPGMNHVVIVNAVLPNGSIRISHANWPRGSGPTHDDILDVSTQKKYGITFAVR